MRQLSFDGLTILCFLIWPNVAHLNSGHTWQHQPALVDSGCHDTRLRKICSSWFFEGYIFPPKGPIGPVWNGNPNSFQQVPRLLKGLKLEASKLHLSKLYPISITFSESSMLVLKAPTTLALRKKHPARVSRSGYVHGEHVFVGSQ